MRTAGCDGSTRQSSLSSWPGSTSRLCNALENEVAYLDQVKKADLAKAVRTRLEGVRAM